MLFGIKLVDFILGVSEITALGLLPVIFYILEVRKPKAYIKRLYLVKSPINNLYEEGEIYIDESMSNFDKYPFHLAIDKYSSQDVGKFNGPAIVQAQEALLNEKIRIIHLEVINHSRKDTLYFTGTFFLANGNPNMIVRKRLLELRPLGWKEQPSIQINPGESKNFYFLEQDLLDRTVLDYFLFPVILKDRTWLIRKIYNFRMKINLRNTIYIKAGIARSKSAKLKINTTSNKIKFNLPVEIAKPTSINTLRAARITSLLLEAEGTPIEKIEDIQKNFDRGYQIALAIENLWYFDPNLFNFVEFFRKFWYLRYQRLLTFSIKENEAKKLEENYLFLKQISIYRERYLNYWSNRPKGWKTKRDHNGIYANPSPRIM